MVITIFLKLSISNYIKVQLGSAFLELGNFFNNQFYFNVVKNPACAIITISPFLYSNYLLDNLFFNSLTNNYHLFLTF